MARRRRQIRRSQPKVRNNRTAIRQPTGNQLRSLIIEKMELVTAVKVAITISNSITEILTHQLSG